MKEVILTGIRSNEEPTLGNYLGAFVPMVQMQQQFAGTYQLNMFVPDLHSFTTPIDHSSLYQNTLKNLKYFIAAGLDINDPDTFIYRQSFIPAHSELTWILDCFTYVGEMQRMTQFKEKSAEHAASVTMGLMNYPVLMAVDILLYGARWVPVGEDQFQHIEITRDILAFSEADGSALVDHILDAAGQKGTGKWTVSARPAKSTSPGSRRTRGGRRSGCAARSFWV